MSLLAQTVRPSTPEPAPTVRTLLREPVRTPWRAPLAAASLVAAAAHVPVTAEHLNTALYIGVLFILLEVAAVALAARLLRPPTRGVLLAIAGVGAVAVLALLLSRTTGLPLIGDDVGNWAEPLATVSLVAEAIMAVGGTAAALRPSAAGRRAVIVGRFAAVLILVAGATAIGIATSSAAAPHHMDGMDAGHAGHAMSAPVE